MFFDPGTTETKAPAKADPRSLESFIAWLETKPSAGTYNYADCNGRCLLGQFFKEAFGLRWWDEGITLHNSDDTTHLLRIAGKQPFTFGAALERARKLAA